MAPPEAGAAMPPAPDPGTYPLVEVVTTLGGLDPSDGTLSVRRGEATYRIMEDPACQHTAVAAGQTLFLRPTSSASGPAAELVVLGLGACPIVEAVPR